MDSLLSQFGDLTIAGATVAHRNPYLGSNDPAPDSVVINMDMTQPNAWEDLCNARWPYAPEFEKLILETRFAKAVPWDKMPALLDDYMEKWGKDQYSCYICPFGLSRIAHKNKGRERRFDDVAVRSLAISQYFAAALVAPDPTKLNTGSVWTFPVIHFENALKGEWTNSEVKLKNCQVTFILETSLYAIDDGNLVCIDLTVNKVLYSININEKFKITLTDLETLHVSMTGFILVVSQKCGFAVFYQNSETLSIDLVEYKANPLDPGEDPLYDDLVYTTGAMDLDKLVLGRSDGQVERWTLQRGVENDKTKFSLIKRETWDFFVDQASDHNLRPLKMVSKDPVTGIYARGRRLMVFSKNNRVSLEILEGTPITMLDENKANPIACVSVFGDFIGVLYVNSTLEVGRYSGTKPVYTHDSPKTRLPPFNLIPMGEQRVTAFADMVMVLSQDGHMYNLTLTKIK